MSAFLIALLLLLGIIQSPEDANNLNQDQIDQIENLVIIDQTEV